MDKKSGDEVLELLINFANKLNSTLIIVTHNEEIAELASRRIHLIDGQIVFDKLNPKNHKNSKSASNYEERYSC